MAQTFLNPVKNASTLGFLYIILGVIDLLSVLTTSLSDFMGLLYAAIMITVGFGLRKHKLWAIYAIGVSAALMLLQVFMLSSAGIPITWAVVELAIQVTLFFWLYSARKDFT
jgi:uncharacterized membrane protein (DUF2068 family)